MPQATRLAVLLAVVALAAVSAACDNSNPAGPSASGAVINGSLVADRALPGATVSVAGTSRGATVDGNRRFTLRDVPGGTVQLQFKGPSLDGSIQLSGVQPSDTIELTVTVNGSTVTLASERRGRQGDDDDDDDDDEDEVEFTGTLTARTGVVPNLTLVVAGRTVLTNVATEIRTRHGGDRLEFSAIVVGVTLEVKADRRPDGTLVARRLRVGN